MLYLILDNIARRRGVFWGMVLLNATAFIAIGIAWFVSSLNKYNLDSVSEVISAGIYQSGYVHWEKKDVNAEWSNKEILNLYNTLKNTDEIAAVGAFWYPVGSKPAWTPLIEAQSKLVHNRPDLDEGECEFLTMNFAFADFCGLEIDEGLSLEEAEKLDDEKTAIVYVGANLTEISIGSTHEVKDKEGNVYFKYYVAGVLKENSYWVQNGFGNDGGDVLPVYDKICLDNMFVEFDNREVGFGAYYSPGQGYTLEEATQVLNKISEEFGLTANTEVIANAIEYSNSFNREIIKYSSGIAFLTILTSITIMLCMSLSTFILRSREYGVLYAIGYKKSNMIAITIGENLIKGVVALFFSTAPLIFIVNLLSTYDWSDARKRLFWTGTFPIMFLTMLMVVVFGSVVPVVTFLKKQPVELLENRF